MILSPRLRSFAIALAAFVLAWTLAGAAPSDKLSLTRVARLGGFCTKGIPVSIDCHPFYLGAAFSELVLVDIGDITRPHEVARFELGDSIVDLAFRAGRSYALVKGAGLSIVDWARPELPAVVAEVKGYPNAYKLILAESTAYVADADSGLFAVDLADAAHPIAHAAFEAAGRGKITGMDIEGNRLLVSSGTGGFRIYDIVARLAPPRSASVLSKVDDVACIGEFAYGLDSGELKIYSLADPHFPRGIGSEVLFFQGNRQGAAFRKHQGVLYLAGMNDGILKLDLSNPSMPTVAKTYGVPNSPGFTIGDSLLFSPNPAGYQNVLKFSTQGNLNFVSSLFGNGFGFAIADGYLYLGYGQRFLAVDIRHPEHPQEAGAEYLEEPQTINEARILGDRIFTNGIGPGRSHFNEFKLPSSGQPILIRDILNSGGSVQFTLGDGLLHTFEVSKFIGKGNVFELRPDYHRLTRNPIPELQMVIQSSRYRGAYFVESYTRDWSRQKVFPLYIDRFSWQDTNLAKQGAGIALPGPQLYWWNKNTASQPDGLMEPFQPEYRRLFAFIDDLLYVATPNGIRMLDISDSAAMTLLPQIYDETGNFMGLAYADSALYAVRGPIRDSLGGRTLQKLDVSVPRSPVPVDSFSPGYGLRGLAVQGGYLFLTSSRYNLEVFRMGGTPADTMAASVKPTPSRDCKTGISPSVIHRAVVRPSRGLINAAGRLLGSAGGRTVLFSPPSSKKPASAD